MAAEAGGGTAGEVSRSPVLAHDIVSDVRSRYRSAALWRRLLQFGRTEQSGGRRWAGGRGWGDRRSGVEVGVSAGPGPGLEKRTEL